MRLLKVLVKPDDRQKTQIKYPSTVGKAIQHRDIPKKTAPPSHPPRKAPAGPVFLRRRRIGISAKKTMYGQLRKQLGEVLRELVLQKESGIWGPFKGGPC